MLFSCAIEHVCVENVMVMSLVVADSPRTMLSKRRIFQMFQTAAVSSAWPIHMTIPAHPRLQRRATPNRSHLHRRKHILPSLKQENPARLKVSINKYLCILMFQNSRAS
jgi:hypothetical protein